MMPFNFELMDEALHILSAATSTDEEKLGALVGLHTSAHVRDARYVPRLVPALAQLLYADPTESPRGESKRQLRVQTLGLIKIMIDSSSSEACFAPLHEFCVHLLEQSHDETWVGALKILVTIYTRAALPMLRSERFALSCVAGPLFGYFIPWLGDLRRAIKESANMNVTSRTPLTAVPPRTTRSCAARSKKLIMHEIVYLIGKIGVVDASTKAVSFGIVELVPHIVAVITAARTTADGGGSRPGGRASGRSASTTLSAPLSAELLWTQEMCFELLYFLRKQWLSAGLQELLERSVKEEMIECAATLLVRASASGDNHLTRSVLDLHMNNGELCAAVMGSATRLGVAWQLAGLSSTQGAASQSVNHIDRALAHSALLRSNVVPHTVAYR